MVECVMPVHPGTRLASGLCLLFRFLGRSHLGKGGLTTPQGHRRADDKPEQSARRMVPDTRRAGIG
jgi:hypothetical protein